MKVDFEKRKRMRLKGYDYSNNATYFITICTHKREKILSEIINTDHNDNIPEIQLTPVGVAVENSIEFIQNNNDKIEIINYMIMPNHVHLIIHVIDNNGASMMPHPTTNTTIINKNANAIIPKIISALKRYTNKNQNMNIWQRSYYDHIIRNNNEYDKINKYIDDNPLHWKNDCYKKNISSIKSVGDGILDISNY